MLNQQPEINFDADLTPGSIKSAMKEAGAGSRDLWQVPPSELHVLENFNVRVKNEDHYNRVREYADSMKAEGYYQHKPIAGYIAKRDGVNVIFITDGHTRHEAVLLAISEGADIPVVPVVVSQSGVNLEDLTVALVRSNSGQPLTPYEIGVVCKRLVRFGYEPDQIAQRLGFSGQYVNNLLSLMAAPLEIRSMVTDQIVSASMAIEMIGQHGEKALAKLQEAQTRATASGKKRVTKKMADPAAEFNRALKKQAPAMFDLLKQVQDELKNNPSDFGLSLNLTQDIDATLSELAAVQPLAS